MPYKDPIKAKEASRKAVRKYEASHREERRLSKRERYWQNPEKERRRIALARERNITEERCVNCRRPRDREGKTLCSVCAPKFAKSIKAYHTKIKTAAFNAYGGAICTCCGESRFEFMSIDHIEGNGSSHRKELRGGDGYSGGGGGRLYLWLKRNNYPKGYRVLCRNCNSSFGENGYCPHERERVDGTREPISSSRT